MGEGLFVEPRILLLHCAESGRRALQNIRQNGASLPLGVRTFELSCTGRVNEVLLMESLEKGFEGIVVVACHKENCRFLDGNLRAEAGVLRIKRLLSDAEIAGKDVEILFVSPDEGLSLVRKLDDWIDQKNGDSASAYSTSEAGVSSQ